MIVLYTLPSCYHCHQVKRELNQKEIPFNEITVTPEIADDLTKKTDQLVLPIIFFNDEIVSLDEAIERYGKEN